VSIGLILLTTVGCAAQQSSAEKSQEPRQQRKESQTMGKMSMDEMMKQCKEHHQSAMKSIDQMSKMMDGAKQSNDPAKMRSTLDQSHKQLGEMKEHMTMCGNMMSMMEKMQGMGGMKGDPK
jgi:small-conductance mechanosensitive channel